jgi:hypothetical protein
MVFRSIGFVILLMFFSATTLAESITVDVSITLIDTNRSSITVSYDGKSRQLELAKNLQVEIDGKKSEIRSLKAGDSALVEYDKERQVVTRIIVRTELMQPAAMIAEGWDEIDQRLIFLMVRLANLEASLEAISRTIDGNNRLANRKTTTARRAERSSEEMDRMGGGPLKWSQFYGMTAEKFFYHPTDRNSTYHTVTVLNQQGFQADNKVGGGVPSSQGLPVHQRPPQFDYIYRANEKSKARAEAEAYELKDQLEALENRRNRLEAEQAGLWIEIAFRAISQYDLDKKPMYRFEPLLIASDTESRQRNESMRAATMFMALALSIIAESERDQAGTFTKIKPAVANARQSLNDTFLRLGVESTDRQSSLGRFFSLAKRLDDIASNLTDSYLIAVEGDSAKDQQRKDTFRGQLQQSLLSYAQIILAMDEMLSLTKTEYGFEPNLDRQLEFASLRLDSIPKSYSSGSTGASPGLNNSVPSTTPKTNQPSLKPVRWKPKMDNEKSIKEVFRLVGNWRLESEGLKLWRDDASNGHTTINTTKGLVGDFSLKMVARVVLQPKDIYQIKLMACGETFAINEEGTFQILLERKDGKVSLAYGNKPPVTIVIKEAHLDKPSTLAIQCFQNHGYPGKSEILIGGLEIVGRTPANVTP